MYINLKTKVLYLNRKIKFDIAEIHAIKFKLFLKDIQSNKRDENLITLLTISYFSNPTDTQNVILGFQIIS